MQRASDVLWQPAVPKRYLMRWVWGLAAAAAAAALALIGGGMLREPETVVAKPPHLDQPPMKNLVEPVRMLNPSRRSAPALDEPPVRLPAPERITASPSAPVPMRQAPTDYQDLRRQLLKVE
jgi:hypothetical protein